jgi:hypothetical protein
MTVASKRSWAVSKYKDAKQARRLVDWQAVPAVLRPMDAREFNELEFDEAEGSVRKRGRIEGEAFYYEQIPEELRDLFPACRVTRRPVFELQLELLQGTTLSRRLSEGVGETGQRLSLRHFDLLWAALRRLHSTNPRRGERAIPADVLHANYAPKLRQRFCEFGHVYQRVGHELNIDMHVIYDHLQSFFEGDRGYSSASAGRAVHAWYIHGDPVFSNVLLSDRCDEVKLVDMRGKLGDGSDSWLSTQGDVAYDLSKVLQSLLGYDLMLLDQWPPNKQQIFDLELLQHIFAERVKSHYPRVSFTDLRWLAAQHFFAIVPLHNDQPHRQRWYGQVASDILHQGALFQDASSVLHPQ